MFCEFVKSDKLARRMIGEVVGPGPESILERTSLQKLGMTRRPLGPSKTRREIGCSEDQQHFQ